MNPLLLTGVLATFEFTIENIINIFNPKVLNIPQEETRDSPPEISLEQRQEYEFYEQIKAQIALLEKEIYELGVEAEKFNNPSTFAQYSKRQRQIATKQKEVDKLKLQLSSLPPPRGEQKSEVIQQEEPKQLEILSNQRIASVMSKLVSVIVLFIARGKYFLIQGVDYNSLYPLSYMMARKQDNFLEISYFCWFVISYTVIRVIKEFIK